MTNYQTEIQRLQDELEQEISLRDSLETSANQLEETVTELERKLLDETDEAGNEWKEKYEEQYETNQHLEKQLASLNDKIAELTKLDPEDDDSKITKRMNDADLRKMIRQLEHERKVLQGTLKDYEWRLDSESQDLFRLNEEKAKYKLELNQAMQQMDEVRLQARTPNSFRSTTPIPGINFNSRKADFDPKLKQYGIPDNQRILDPRKGPIKKTAAVKRLPKLKTSNSADSILPEKSKSGRKKGERKVRSSDNSLAEGIKDINNNLHTPGEEKSQT